MRPLGHLAITTGISAGIYGATGSLSAAGLQAVCGILIDTDHIIEFVGRNKDFFNIRKFFYERANETYAHIVFIFHSWELALILGFLTTFLWSPLHGAMVSLGMIQHLMLDQWKNSSNPLSYFLIYRALHGFRSKDTFPEKEKEEDT